MSKLGIILAAGSAAIFASSASAATFTGIATGSWSNPDATTGYSISNNDLGGTADVNWGNPVTTNFNNLWSFDGLGSDGGAGWTADTGILFSFGDFTYRNGSVDGHDFKGADLSVNLQIQTPLVNATTYDFEFDVLNVPNTTGDAVLDGDIADIIGSVSSQFFSYGGVNYTLSLFGFSQDGGATLTTGFNSPEGATQTAQLYGIIDEVDGGPSPSPVPLPAGGVLMLTGLIGLGAASRKRKKK